MNDIIYFLKNYGELLSITLIPVIIWFLGIQFQNRQAKRKAKEGLFLRLMAHRKKYPPNQEFADALNQIDVVFQESSKVRNSWRAYFDSLHPSSQHNSLQNAFLLDLLSDVANDLGYHDIKQTELDRFYVPQYFLDQVNNQDLFYTEYLRILQRSKNLAEPFSEKELKERVKQAKKGS